MGSRWRVVVLMRMADKRKRAGIQGERRKRLAEKKRRAVPHIEGYF